MNKGIRINHRPHSPPWRTISVALIALLAACGDADAPVTDALAAMDASDAELPSDSLYGAPAAENVRVVPVEVEVRGLAAGLDGIRIAAVSDLQLGLWDDNTEVAAAAVQRAASSGADVVALLGGYIARGDDVAALGRVLAPLRGRPAVAVLGAGDVATDSLVAGISRTFAEQGIQLLNNNRVPVSRGGDTAYIVGVAPGFVNELDWRRAEIAVDLAGPPGSAVLLSNLPAAAASLPTRRYAAALAGHTVCGEVPVPGAARLAQLDNEVFPGARVDGTERVFRVNDNPLVVSCGVGYSFLPARFVAPPEVLLLTLRRAAEEPAPERGPTPPPDSVLLP